MPTLAHAFDYLAYHGNRALNGAFLTVTGHVPLDLDGQIVAGDVLLKNAPNPETKQYLAAQMWQKLQDQAANGSMSMFRTSDILFAEALRNSDYQGLKQLATPQVLAPALSDLTGQQVEADTVQTVVGQIDNMRNALTNARSYGPVSGRF